MSGARYKINMSKMEEHEIKILSVPYIVYSQSNQGWVLTPTIQVLGHESVTNSRRLPPESTSITACGSEGHPYTNYKNMPYQKCNDLELFQIPEFSSSENICIDALVIFWLLWHGNHWQTLFKGQKLFWPMFSDHGVLFPRKKTVC